MLSCRWTPVIFLPLDCVARSGKSPNAESSGHDTFLDFPLKRKLLGIQSSSSCWAFATVLGESKKPLCSFELLSSGIKYCLKQQLYDDGYWWCTELLSACFKKYIKTHLLFWARCKEHSIFIAGTSIYISAFFYYHQRDTKRLSKHVESLDLLGGRVNDKYCYFLSLCQRHTKEPDNSFGHSLKIETLKNHIMPWKFQ